MAQARAESGAGVVVVVVVRRPGAVEVAWGPRVEVASDRRVVRPRRVGVAVMRSPAEPPPAPGTEARRSTGAGKSRPSGAAELRSPVAELRTPEVAVR